MKKTLLSLGITNWIELSIMILSSHSTKNFEIFQIRGLMKTFELKLKSLKRVFKNDSKDIYCTCIWQRNRSKSIYVETWLQIQSPLTTQDSLKDESRLKTEQYWHLFINWNWNLFMAICSPFKQNATNFEKKVAI